MSSEEINEYGRYNNNVSERENAICEESGTSKKRYSLFELEKTSDRSDKTKRDKRRVSQGDGISNNTSRFKSDSDNQSELRGIEETKVEQVTI